MLKKISLGVIKNHQTLSKLDEIENSLAIGILNKTFQETEHTLFWEILEDQKILHTLYGLK